MEIQVGDVVHINSEKEFKMTVVSCTDGKATCLYLSDGEVKFLEVPIVALTKIIAYV